jgi:Alkylmercury lyase
MNALERAVRASIYASLRDHSEAPSAAALGARLGASPGAVVAALRALADEHCLALVPGTDAVWMAHPFSAVETDFVVRIGARRWFANCAWDGLAILALLGDGALETHSPATGAPVRFAASGGRVAGADVVHFLVPPRRFWDDIGYT